MFKRLFLGVLEVGKEFFPATSLAPSCGKIKNGQREPDASTADVFSVDFLQAKMRTLAQCS